MIVYQVVNLTRSLWQVASVPRSVSRLWQLPVQVSFPVVKQGFKILMESLYIKLWIKQLILMLELTVFQTPLWRDRKIVLGFARCERVALLLSNGDLQMYVVIG